MLETNDCTSDTATTTSTTPTTATTTTTTASANTPEEKTQRRRSTFYVPLVIEDVEAGDHTDRSTKSSSSLSSSNASLEARKSEQSVKIVKNNANSGGGVSVSNWKNCAAVQRVSVSAVTSVAAGHSLVPKLPAAIQEKNSRATKDRQASSSNCSARKMTPPCGLNWSITGRAGADCVESDDEVIIAISEETKKKKMTAAVKKKSNGSATKKLDGEVAHAPTRKLDVARTKRYGIVLNGNNSDDDGSSCSRYNNNNTCSSYEELYTLKTNTASDKSTAANGGHKALKSESNLSSATEVELDDEDSEICRVQTNTSTPIKMMKSRSRTNILSVPLPEDRLNVAHTARTAPLLMKSKTMPQNLSPSLMYEMSKAHNESTISVAQEQKCSQRKSTVNSSLGNVHAVAHSFSPKSLFSLKSSPKLFHAKDETVLPSASVLPKRRNNVKNSSSDSAICNLATVEANKQKSPPKKSLSFIRRAHSTKLSRSNSWLKSLPNSSQQSSASVDATHFCFGGNWSKDMYINYDVQPLSLDELTTYLGSDHGADFLRERFKLNTSDCLQPSQEQSLAGENCHRDSPIDSGEHDDAGHHSGKKA